MPKKKSKNRDRDRDEDVIEEEWDLMSFMV